MSEKKIYSPELHFEVQTLLYEEAALLDSWQLNAWLALFTEDGEYQVPPSDLEEGATPDNALFYIADDRDRLEERVKRLEKKTCHSEYPRSKVRHLVSNIRVLDEKNGELYVEAAYACFRSKDGVTDTFMGRYDYRLVRVAGQLKIRFKRCLMDMDGLRPHGRISIIL